MTTEKSKPWCFGKKLTPMLSISCSTCEPSIQSKCITASRRKK